MAVVPNQQSYKCDVCGKVNSELRLINLDDMVYCIL